VVTNPTVRRFEDRFWWRAFIEGEEAGDLRLLVRPDARRFAIFDSCRSGIEKTLLEAVDEEIGSELYLSIGETDEPAMRLYEQLGFVVHRHESVYAVPTDPSTTGLETKSLPGIKHVSAAHVDEERLRVLDDALRQDVPGTDGWHWDAAAFHEETFDPAYFDPATYLVAVEEASGGYIGLARVWINPGGPRLGLVAVLPVFRRRGLARSLLAHVFAVLHERGVAELSAEVDDANVASTVLLTSLGAQRIGGNVELRREARGRCIRAVAGTRR
jgi:ribosomal protein S18 acetylase RimI-like enzyme